MCIYGQTKRVGEKIERSRGKGREKARRREIESWEKIKRRLLEGREKARRRLREGCEKGERMQGKGREKARKRLREGCEKGERMQGKGREAKADIIVMDTILNKISFILRYTRSED